MLFTEKIKKLTKNKYKVEECSVSEKDCVSGKVGVLVGALLVFFMITSITYALYMFIHASGLSTLAGVHITPPLKIAANEFTNGNVESINGYDGWLTYKNDVFELKYQDDWEMQEINDGKHIVSFKKYNNSGRLGFDSLAATIFVGATPIPEGLSAKEVLLGKGVVWNNLWKQKIIGGKPGIRTGEFESESGVIKNMIFWELDGKLYSMEVDYLNANIIDTRSTFEKMVTQFKFL